MDFYLEILKHAIIGFIMAFLGLLSPGFLTLTTLNTAINRGSKETVKFAFGAVIPIFIQAHLALLGAEYLKNHPWLLQQFSGAASVIFFLMALLFFHQFTKRHKPVIKRNKINIRNSFFYGLIVSLINPLAIPFYFTYTGLLEYKGILILKEPYISFFVLGAMFGAFIILYLYAKHALRILSKIQLLAKNFKLILAIIMFLLSISSFMAYKSI
jgi:threonine/homoserine/homoserine lactone efflux protein